VAEGNPKSTQSGLFALVVAAAAWAVPGLGHLLLRKWGRAAVFFVSVATLALTGVALRGHIFARGSGDLFDMLGFLADLGAGGFYFVCRTIENGGPDVSRAAGDYGTRFFATAGVLNLLCVLDAYQIASGQKD
jgi:drug/metabolite transporter (DMT)-like permease